MIITSLRSYEKDRTTAEVYVDGEIFGSSLEDAARAPNVKVYGETCIPNGCYKIAITRSGRFKKDMMVIYNVAGNHSIERSGISFTGIRVHGGTTIEHTSGCVLLNNYGVLQVKVQSALARGETVHWIFEDKP